MSAALVLLWCSRSLTAFLADFAWPLKMCIMFGVVGSDCDLTVERRDDKGALEAEREERRRVKGGRDVRPRRGVVGRPAVGFTMRC